MPETVCKLLAAVYRASLMIRWRGVLTRKHSILGKHGAETAVPPPLQNKNWMMLSFKLRVHGEGSEGAPADKAQRVGSVEAVPSCAAVSQVHVVVAKDVCNVAS